MLVDLVVVAVVRVVETRVDDVAVDVGPVVLPLPLPLLHPTRVPLTATSSYHMVFTSPP